VTDILVRISDLTKRYGPLTALSGVSFSIRHGEVLGLIGPNGSGKTTLFECLGGVLPAEGGAVLHADGRPLTPQERTALLFYLPDAIAPWPMQSVRWALEFATGFFGGRTGAFNDIVSGLDLKPLLGARLGELSKGQRKRTLLAVGLLMPQAILLADEPFDGLDLRQSRDLAFILRDFVAEGRTMVLSIHQVMDAARVCDRFVLLSSGRVCGEGTLAELSDSAGLSRAVPRVNLEEVFLALT